jgi:hypothetical protein
MRTLAEQMGVADSIADKADGSVPRENLLKFQNTLEQNVKKLVADINEGLEEREGPPVDLGVDLGVYSKTKEEFPKIVNLPNNIFDRSSKDFGKESSNDQSRPLDVSFDHNSNITFKAAVIDAVIHKSSEGLEALTTKEVDNSVFETYAKDAFAVAEAFFSSVKKAVLPETTDEQELDIGEKKMGEGDAAETKEQPKEDILGNASQLSPTNREKMMASNPQARVAPVSLKTMHDNKMGLLGQLGTFLLKGANAVVSGVTTQGAEVEGVMTADGTMTLEKNPPNVVNYTKETDVKFKHLPKNIANIKKLTGADVIKTGNKGVQSVSNMNRKSLSFVKEMFSDSTLKDLWVGYEKGTQIPEVKQINDARRLDGADNSSHKHGHGIDLSSSWTGSMGATYKIRDTANRKTINLFKTSLTNKGWTVVKKDGKEIVEKQIAGKGKNQYWMKFSKGKDIRYVEVVSNPRHIHLHTGEGFAGGWK